MIPELSVVIPTLDEAPRLPRLLEELAALGDGVEVVVTDGGSSDGTRERARQGGARVVRVTPGRGTQLRAGARAARGRWLLFLHADCSLSAEAARSVLAFMARGEEDRAAHFPFALDASGWWWRAVEMGQRLRERLTGLVYGDQGLLISRSLYERVGGHPAWPLMEDVEVVDRIRNGGRLDRLEPPLPTSPRRYRREGRTRAWIRNTGLLLLFRLGVPPERLLRWYAPEPPSGATTARRTLLVFAKAPRPGTVKTRLAADLGDGEAARIYRALGAGVVRGVRSGAWRTVVSFAPADAREEMVSWLGASEVEFRPQAGGDLGARMEAASRQAFAEGASQVCIVGTDAPEVDEETVARAFGALDDHDVALGPAEDGGYYLLALRRHCSPLFRDIPWSTSRVLERTLRRAREAGLRTHLLPTLRDVDRLADVPPELLEA